MSWSLYISTVIYGGAALLLLQLSGKKLLMDFAGMLMQTPIRVHKAKITIALFMTGFCSCLCLLTYSGLRRAEGRRNDPQNLSAFMQGGAERLERDCFFAGRNFYASLLGLTLWGASWQLKNLLDNKTLVVQSSKWKQVSHKYRFTCLGIFLLCFCIADVPLCRLNYNFQLTTFITPKKEKLLTFSADNNCGAALLNQAATEQCKEFCRESRKLSEDRLWAINWVRNFHMFGRLAAQYFDGFRGVEQGKERIDQLFKEKTCERVIQSVDRSNSLVNFVCIVGATASIVGCFLALQAMIDAPAVAEEKDAAPAAKDAVVGIALPKEPLAAAGPTTAPAGAEADARSPTPPPTTTMPEATEEVPPRERAGTTSNEKAGTMD